MEDPADRRAGGADETAGAILLRHHCDEQELLAWGRLAAVEFADEDTGAPFAYMYRYLEKQYMR